MLIVSKFKDYYDTSMGIHGIDKTVVYERNEEEYSTQNGNYYMPDEIRNIFYQKKFWNDYEFDMIKKHQDDFFNMFVLGFCGKFYLGVKFYRIVDNTYSNAKEVVTYDIEEMKTYFVNRRRYNTKIYDHAKLDILADIIKKLNTLDTFRKFKTPIFIAILGNGHYRTPKIFRETTFIVNPSLKEYGFFKVMDAFQAFQEIQMFMGGVLGSPEKEIVQIEDKYKITQHGFDKWSFRKEPKEKR